jgi:hypothetical protein
MNPVLRRLLEERQQVSTQHKNRRERDKHQRSVIEFPWSIGATVKNNCDAKNKHATSERDTRFSQTHARNR